MKRRIRVLQVVTGLVPGGAERLLLDMMQRFDEERFEVRLATIVDNLAALQVYGYPNQHVEIFDLRNGKRFVNLLRMHNYIREFSPDVIHAHMFHSLLASVVARGFCKYRPAICFTSHLNRYSWLRALIVKILKSWRQADVIFDSLQHPQMNSAKTQVIPNGVPVALTPPVRKAWSSADTVRLLSVGRLAEQKDPLGLLRAIYLADLPNWSLDLVGAGPLEDQTRALAKELGMESRVIFHGMRNDVRSFMRNADIFVMHSKYEGMPMALLEAGAEAMPILSTPVGSIPDIVGPDMGVLATPEHFSRALKTMAESPEQSLLAGQVLHSRVLGRHSIDVTVKAHQGLYAELAEQVSGYES